MSGLSPRSLRTVGLIETRLTSTVTDTRALKDRYEIPVRLAPIGHEGQVRSDAAPIKFGG